MNIAGGSSKRPIAVFMLLCMVAIIGFIAFQKMHVELIPQLEYPYVAVFATYMGATPEEIEELVVNPIEDIISTVPGVAKFTSISKPGLGLILVEFQWGVDVMSATSRLERYLNLSISNLPEGVRPSVVEFDPSIMPVFTFSVTETSEDLKDVVSELKRLPDVAGVEELNKAQRIVQVVIDPEKAKKYQLDISVLDTFLAGNAVYPLGEVVDEEGNLLTVTVDGKFKSLDELKKAVIGFRGLSSTKVMSGQLPNILLPIRLEQVANIAIVDTEKRGCVRVNGKPAAVIAVRKRSGANTVKVVQDVKKLLENHNISYVPLMDQSEYTNKAVGNLLRNLLLGLIGAALVVMLFLGDVLSTIVVSLSIPISLLMAVVFMYFFKLNVDLLTLGGLTMAVGMLVDNTIVVFENIYRHKSRGESFNQAAAKGTSEVWIAIFVSTTTTVIVFVPLLFTQNLASTMFKYFAATLALALGSSLLVAGIIVPAASRWIKVKRHPIFDRFTDLYGRIVEKALEKKAVVLLPAVVLVVISAFFISSQSASFIPKFESNMLMVNVEMDRQLPYEETARIIEDLENKIISGKDSYGIESVYSEIGITSELAQIVSDAAQNKATITVVFSGSRQEFISNKKRFIADLEQLSFPGKIAVAEMNFLQQLFGYPVTIEFRGNNIDELVEKAHLVREELSKRNLGTVTVRSKPQLTTLHVQIDRDRSLFAGILPAQIFMELQLKTVGKQFGTIEVGDSVLPIFLKVGEIETTFDVEHAPLHSFIGKDVLLGSVTDIATRTALSSIFHDDGERIMYVDISSDLPVSTLYSQVEKTLSSLNLGTVKYSVSGQKSSMDTLLSDFRIVIYIAVVLIFMFLSAQFESLRLPLVIFATVPVGIIGLAAAILVFNYPLNLPVLVGVLTLSGVVVNNAIVMVTVIKQLCKDNRPLRWAIVEGAKMRLRPIMMTTLTTVIALLPTALSRAEGRELESPIAWTVILGLSITTLFTLFGVPSLFELLHRKKA